MKKRSNMRFSPYCNDVPILFTMFLSIANSVAVLQFLKVFEYTCWKIFTSWLNWLFLGFIISIITLHGLGELVVKLRFRSKIS